jgi:flagellar protein FlgJ
MQVSSIAPSIPTLTKQQQQLQNACQQFEGYFLNMMFQEMRKTVPQSGLLGDQSNQQQIFTGMMDQTMADAMSKRGDLGLSQMLYKQLAPALGSATNTPSEPTADEVSGQ